MNILFITQLFPEKKEGCYTSGALREFIEEWGKRGHLITVIRPHFSYEIDPFPNEPKFKISDNVDVEFIRPFRIPILKMGFYSSKKIIENLKFTPDIIVCHLYNSYFTFHKLARILNIPLVIGIHMSDMKISKNKLFRLRQLRIFKNATSFACRSIAYKEIFDNTFPTLSHKSFLAMSGIPENFLNMKRNRAFDNKHVKIITVSSLIKRKQIDKLIYALSELKHISWELMIAGEGPELDTLMKIANNTETSDRITFAGKLKRNTIINELIDHDVFVLPSYDETFGLVYLEAMACGNLTIGSKNEGIDGIIIDGYNGFLCDAHNNMDLLFKLKNALTINVSEFSSITTNAINTAKNFTIRKMSQNYLDNIELSIKK